MKYIRIELENWQLIVNTFSNYTVPLAQAKEAVKLLDALNSAEEIEEKTEENG